MSDSIAMIKPDEIKLNQDAYLGGLLQLNEQKSLSLPDELAKIVTEVHRQAANQVVQLNIPTTKDEDWRFTDISELQKQDWINAHSQELTEFQLNQFVLAEAKNSRLVFVNGFYAPELSDVSGLPEQVYVGSLSNLDAKKIPQLSKYLAVDEPKDQVFTTKIRG